MLTAGGGCGVRNGIGYADEVKDTLFILCFYHTPCISVKRRLKLTRYTSHDWFVGSFIGRPVFHSKADNLIV